MPTQPVAVFSDMENCDTKHEHLIRVVAGSTHAYAYGPIARCPRITRDGAQLVVQCDQPTGYDARPCHGEVVFQTGTPGTWTGDLRECDLLAQYGARIER